MNVNTIRLRFISEVGLPLTCKMEIGKRLDLRLSLEMIVLH